MEVFEFHRFFIALLLATIRPGVTFWLCPPLTDSMIPGTARLCAILCFSFLAVPPILLQLPAGEPQMVVLALVALQEVLIGAVIGFFSAVPFWIAENIGNFIDNQRGATMGEVYSPLSGAQVSTTAIFFTQVVSTIFFVSGAVLLVLSALYQSYAVWPIFKSFVSISPGAPELILGSLGTMLMKTVVISAPVIILMFLATIGLGFVNRTAPQLNVFFLSMPIKSALGVAMLVIYLQFIMDKLMYTKVDELLSPAVKLLGGG